MSWKSKITIPYNASNDNESQQIARASETIANEIYEIILSQELKLDFIIEECKIDSQAYLLLEVFIRKTHLDTRQIYQVYRLAAGQLEIRNDTWDWSVLGSQVSRKTVYSLRLLRELLISQEHGKLDIMRLLACYTNPNLPWTSEITEKIVGLVDVEDMMEELIETELKPNLLVLPKVAGKKALQGGLNPRLGYGGAKREILEEDARRNWKSGTKVKALSVAYFIIKLAPSTFWSAGNWRVISSFILNVGDDHDPLFKYQSVKLLALMTERLEQLDHIDVIRSSGLIDVLLESVRKCLVYYPSTTTVNTSLLLLDASYPLLFKLFDISGTDWTEIMDVISSNIMGAISHLIGTVEASSGFPVVCFLLDQLSEIVATSIKTKILISISRLFFMLNLIITNITVLDNFHEGQSVLEKALYCQSTVLHQFLPITDDQEIEELLGSYKHDLVGAWLVLAKRLANYEYDNVKLQKQMSDNFSLLEQLQKGNKSADYADFLDSMKKQVPEMSYFVNIRT